MQLTKEQKKELKDICDFYIKDPDMIQAFTTGMTTFIEKISPESTVKPFTFDDYMKTLLNEVLDERGREFQRRAIQLGGDVNGSSSSSFRNVCSEVLRGEVRSEDE